MNAAWWVIFAGALGLAAIAVIVAVPRWTRDHEQPQYPEANEDHEWFFEELLKEKREGEA